MMSLPTILAILVLVLSHEVHGAPLFSLKPDEPLIQAAVAGRPGWIFRGGDTTTPPPDPQPFQKQIQVLKKADESLDQRLQELEKNTDGKTREESLPLPQVATLPPTAFQVATTPPTPQPFQKQIQKLQKANEGLEKRVKKLEKTKATKRSLVQVAMTLLAGLPLLLVVYMHLLEELLEGGSAPGFVLGMEVVVFCFLGSVIVKALGGWILVLVMIGPWILTI